MVSLTASGEYLLVAQSNSLSAITALDFVSTSTDDQTINGTAASDTLIGGSGSDTFTTGAGTDEIYGYGGDDTITINGAGDKTVDGGAGTDSLVINYAGITSLGDFAISESGDYTVFTSSGGDVIQFKNIENLSVGGIAYTATGSDTDGYNVVNGYVSTAQRTLYLYPGSSPTSASLGSAAQFEQVFGTKTSCVTDDYTIVGSTADETLDLNVSSRKGSTSAECFTGGWIIDLKSGADTITSAKVINTDSINLGSDNDSISLMLGVWNTNAWGVDVGGVTTITDANLALLDGGTGIDTIRYDESTNATGSAITLSTAGASNFENIVGSPNAETITGDSGANALAGGNYSDSSTVVDTLNGEAGDDLLLASYNTTGLCNDCFNTLPVTFNGSSINAASATLNNYHTLSYSSSYYFSSSGAHTFNGGAGDDKIFGGKGDETLTGGAGQDFMHGGLGVDTFVIASGDGNTSLALADVVYDFTDGTDLIGLDGINYNDLTIEQGTGDYANHVLVRYGAQYLLVLQNVSLSDITDRDFTPV